MVIPLISETKSCLPNIALNVHNSTASSTKVWSSIVDASQYGDQLNFAYSQLLGTTTMGISLGSNPQQMVSRRTSITGCSARSEG